MLNSGSKCLAAEKELNRIHNSPEVQQYTKQRKVSLVVRILLRFYRLLFLDVRQLLNMSLETRVAMSQT